MDGAILEKRDRSDAPEDFNWVIRARIQSEIDDHYHRAKSVIEQHLGAYYGNRQGNVFARAGVTPRATVDLFESQATGLAGTLAGAIAPLSRSARAFQMIAEVMSGFITYIDLVIGRIGPRIDLEMRDLARSKEAPRGIGDMWAESRERVVESLQKQRSQFAVPAKPEPDPVPKPAPFPEGEVFSAMPEPEEAPPVAAEPCAPPPTKRDWTDMWAEIAVQLCTQKLQPGNQADIRQAMAECLASQGVDCDDAEVDECARRFWQKFVATQRVTSTLSPDDDREMGLGASMFDSLAWQSGSFRIPGLASYSNIHPPVSELHYSTANTTSEPEPDEPSAFGRLERDPGFLDDRFHLSRALGPGPGLTAPYIDIG